MKISFHEALRRVFQGSMDDLDLYACSPSEVRDSLDEYAKDRYSTSFSATNSDGRKLILSTLLEVMDQVKSR
jgi:hypothetical protein